MKLVLPFLETMLTQVCNLSCVGCTNYSDMQHSGYVKWADGKSQLEPWLDRLDIPDFGLIGGEPLINPEYRDWIYGCRGLMPNSQLRFTTNGELLHKRLDVLDTVFDVGNIVFKISVHRHNAKLEDTINHIFSKYKWEIVSEFGITRYKAANNVRLQINRPQVFIKSFQGEYATMSPYHSDPKSSFDICIQQTCPLLHNGVIYKCSTSGLLSETLKRTNNESSPLWKPYKSSGISLASSTEELQAFINNFGKPAATCAMCPTSRDSTAIVPHQNNVK